MVSFLSSYLLTVLPVAYEVDFGALPAANTAAKYKFTLVWNFDGMPPFKCLSTVGVETGPTKVADYFAKWDQDDPAWKLKRTGDRIVFYACGDIRVTSIVVLGDGPKPVVRRVINLPKPKKS